jgi:hypothetical protein
MIGVVVVRSMVGKILATVVIRHRCRCSPNGTVRGNGQTFDLLDDRTIRCSLEVYMRSGRQLLIISNSWTLFNMILYVLNYMDFLTVCHALQDEIHHHQETVSGDLPNRHRSATQAGQWVVDERPLA